MFDREEISGNLFEQSSNLHWVNAVLAEFWLLSELQRLGALEDCLDDLLTL